MYDDIAAKRGRKVFVACEEIKLQHNDNKKYVKLFDSDSDTSFIMLL